MKTRLLIAAISMIGCTLTVANEDHLIVVPKPIQYGGIGEMISIAQIPFISGYGLDFESYCPRIVMPCYAERNSPSQRDQDENEVDVNPASIAGIGLSVDGIGADSTYDVTIHYDKVKEQHWLVDAQLLRVLVQCIYQYGDSITDFKVRFKLKGIPKESELHAVLEKCVEDRKKTTTKAEQGGTGQPATRPESKSEGGDKPQPEAEGRSR
jgi:hypothetical protein